MIDQALAQPDRSPASGGSADSSPAEVPAGGATVRAIITGIVIGALLTPCNIYSGLKIGWSFNMSIIAALLSFAFWRVAEDLAGTRPWHLQENVINQTTASSAASIVSGGLVAPIPALTLLTGAEFSWPMLCLWVFCVSALGIVVAVVLRNPLLVRDKLVFPAGVATAETVREIYAKGREAAGRVRMLVGATLLSGGLKIVTEVSAGIGRWAPSVALPAGGALRETGVTAIGLKNLGFVFDPSLLMIGFGAIIGLRAGLSLLLGAVVAWLALAPWLLAQGWASAGPVDTAWFGPLVEWLLWPGVTLMSVAALSDFVQAGLQQWLQRRQRHDAGSAPEAFPVDKRRFAIGAVSAAVLAIVVQYALFDISPLLGLLAVLLAFVLAVIAARVVGETGIPPIGAIGKVAQLGFGIAAPSNLTMNLMGANVTGGAAGQCADLLNDLRTGQLLGTSVGRQVIAQCFGVLTGSLIGSFAYLLLIPDPKSMLLTERWPAPAVATWKAVAEVMNVGLQSIPDGAGGAMIIAAALGLAASIAQRRLPVRWRAWVPSAPGVGLAFVIPAWTALAMALGAVLATLATRWVPNWSSRFVLVIAAGFVAGESLAGVAAAIWSFGGT